MNDYLHNGICVLVDGGCLNNNKPVTERHMYFSLKVYHKGQPVKSTYQKSVNVQHRVELGLTESGEGSNQLAEVLAAEGALTYVQSLSDRDNRVATVTILQDSEYGMGWASGAYKGNNKTGATVKAEAQQCASLRRYLETKGVKVEFKHVPESWVKSQLGH